MSQCKENDNYYLLCLIKCTNMLSKASRNFFEKKKHGPIYMSHLRLNYGTILSKSFRHNYNSVLWIDSSVTILIYFVFMDAIALNQLHNIKLFLIIPRIIVF